MGARTNRCRVGVRLGLRFGVMGVRVKIDRDTKSTHGRIRKKNKKMHNPNANPNAIPNPNANP